MISFEIVNKNTQVKITGDINEISLVREHFSEINPAYKTTKNKFTKPRLYAITPGGKFAVGILREVLRVAIDNQIQVSLGNNVKKIYKPGWENPTIILPPNLEACGIKGLHPYQEKAAIAALQQGRGISEIATGGGKTLLCATLIESIRYHLKKPDALAVVLVPTIQLVEQTSQDFINYGLTKVTKWSGNNVPDPEARIIVVGTSILMSKHTDCSLLAEADIFLGDEAHGFRRGNSINKKLDLLTTLHQFGFTGTLPPSKMDEWAILGRFGPITYIEKTDSLKEQGFVSDFKVVVLNVQHRNPPKRKWYAKDDPNQPLPTEFYHEELEFLFNSNRRNEIVSKLAYRLPSNSLIIVDRLQHGENLFNKLKEVCGLDRPVYYINGSVDIEEREKIRDLIKTHKDVIIVAIAKIFSTGLNIPNLHNIIFASAGKSKIKIMQSIGRALRLHPSKTLAMIFDIADNTNYGILHLVERRKLYDEEKYDYTEKTIS